MLAEKAVFLGMKCFALLSFVFIVSCSTPRIFSKSKSTTKKVEKREKTKSAIGSIKGSNASSKVLSEAKSYLGVPYKYGGTDGSGLDCSGLVLLSYKKADVALPRVSRDQAKEGFRVAINKVAKGDLLFFNTSGKGISHVGIVENVVGKEVYFIHASVSRGVMISKLSNVYWNPRFVEARRVL